MITLSIAGATPQEVADHVKGFFHQLLLSQEPTEAPPLVPEQPKEEAKLEVPKQEVIPPKTRKKAEKTDAKSKQVDLEEAIAEKAPPVEDVRAALMRLTKAKDDDAVWNLLEEFKAKSASTVPEDKRQALIDKVEEMCR